MSTDEASILPQWHYNVNASDVYFALQSWKQMCDKTALWKTNEVILIY